MSILHIMGCAEFSVAELEAITVGLPSLLSENVPEESLLNGDFSNAIDILSVGGHKIKASQVYKNPIIKDTIDKEFPMVLERMIRYFAGKGVDLMRILGGIFRMYTIKLEDQYHQYVHPVKDRIYEKTVYSDYDANSYPGMMVFGDKAVYDGIRGDEVDSMRDFYKLHLTEHIFDQWFGEIVGCNEATDGWLNKGLRFWFNDYAMANVYGDISERAVGETIREMKKKEPAAMEMKLSDKFPDGKTADIVNTYRGAEFLEDLYGALGKDEFLKAISDYVIKYEFKEADSEKFIEVMKAHTGKDIQAVVDKYF